MKKILLTICLVLVMCIGVGCKKSEIIYDHKSSGWKLWAAGQVNSVRIDIVGSIRTFIVEFVGDLRIEEEDFYNFNEIKEKTTGSIYRHIKSGLNAGYVFMWVEDDENTQSQQDTSSNRSSLPPNVFTSRMKNDAEEKAKVNATTRATTPAEYKWHSAIHQPPTPGETVVIEFKDGLLTMGYYTRTKTWKTDVDRKKLSGGLPLKNVSRWKLVDLR